MKSINIKGKEYYPVVERVKEAHEIWKDEIFSIETEILSNTPERVVVVARVTVGDRVYKGHSQAEWGKGMMGNVALEVAETSAVGRALGFAGIGIDTGIASADEMRKVGAIKKEDIEDDQDLF